MAKQNLMWTALPNGIDPNGNLRVSAMLSPRLTPDADQVLKPFSDFLDWPAALRKARFTIHFGSQAAVISGSETAQPARVDTTLANGDSAIWTALFRPDTFVSGYVFEDHVGTHVLSYDTVAMHSLAQSLYSNLGATTSDSLPKVSALLGDDGWRSLVSAVAVIDREFGESRNGLRNVQQQFAAFKNAGLQSPDNVTSTLLHAQLFHTPPSKPSQQDYTGAPIDAKDPRHDAKWLTFERAKFPDKTEIAKTIDFHQIVAAMNQYPKLLRLLGIVVDFMIPAGTFTDSSNQQLWVTADFGSDPGAGVTRTQASNRTRTRLGAGHFDPLSRPTFQAGDYRVQNGLLTINPDLFAVLQTDVDAAGLKLMNFARTLRKLQENPEQQNDPVSKAQKETGAPALRNAGLMLIHRRRSQLLTNAFTANKQKNNAIEQSFANNTLPGPDLFTEDLIRGWRIDVWDRTSAKWRSLCERHATYTLAGPLTVEDDSEGFTRLAATKAADGSNPDVTYLHEALVSWTGWSLVAQQPGLAVAPDDTTKPADAEVPPGINLSSAFTARPGSLPRLRYGRSYWIRARMTDLAGNSLAPNPKSFADEQPEKHAVLYTRFDPVQSPAIALLRDAGTVEKPLEGESMERIAIRSFNDTPPQNTVPTTASARRFGVPARSSVRDAELHGMLDAGGIVDGSAPTYDLLVKKDVALEQITITTAGPLTDPTATVDSFYSVLDAGAVEIPYLPDPLCTSISARIFDHPTFPAANIIPIPVYDGKAWPHAQPFTIRIFEDPAQVPHFDPATRTLLIPLPKAIRATLRLSSQLADASLNLMGVWNWIPVTARPALLKNAQQGQHWMLTPWKNVELVHAVQRPLIAPELKLVVARNFGDTRAFPRFSATCSIKSTARVDLQATWHEPDADNTGATGADRSRDDHAFSVKITDPLTYATSDINPAGGAVPEHETLGPDLIAVNQNQRLLRKFHELNDTRYRRIQYWLEATTRFREFMPADILTKDDGGTRVETDDNIKVTGPSVVNWVPNSSPPLAPKVLYVVPTFGNTVSTSTNVETRWRRGGGLRVYLDRPWNSSGYGEMLAVVLPPSTFTGDPTTDPSNAPYKHSVTQWGNDPIWSSAFVPGPAPKLTAFPLARTAPDPTGKWLPSFAPATEADQPAGPFPVASLPHPGMVNPGSSTEVVDIAPHDVAYDADRQLWYADIEVNAGASYFPVIRLALAKYHPVSVAGAHLSNIVLADVMALTPDRWLSVTSGVNAAAREISVFGFTYSDSSGHVEAASAPSSIILNRAENPITVAKTSTVEVWVEKLDPTLGEDLGWKRDPSATVTPTPPPVATPPLTPVDTTFEKQRAKLTIERNFNQLAQTIQQLRPIRLWPQLWTGSVTLPATRQPGDRYRIVVAEFEEYIVDDPTPYNRTPSAKDRRMVFLQHIPFS